MKKWYEISVHGCDDSTVFVEALTDEEYKTVKKISDKVTETSEYGCMPVMSIEYANVQESEVLNDD